jgi:simple sugar transport system permease protein
VSRHLNELGLVVALIILFAVLVNTAPNFLTASNLLNILRDAAFTGIIAWGLTLVIVAGEIDISTGSAAAFGSVLLAELVVKGGLPIWLAAILVLAVGGALGMGVGALRAYLNVPTFIGTMALWASLRGLANLMTDALPVPIPDEGFQSLGLGDVFGVPVPTIVMAVLFVVFWFISRRTTFGRAAYAIGGNPDASRLAGISVARVRMLLMATTGMLSALTGIMIAARLGSGNPGAADGLEFDIIAAVVVGGTSLLGGRGSLTGTLMGVLFIEVLGNGLVLMGVNPFAQDVIRGLIILVAVLANVGWQKKR